jgi:hypothetical protein
MTTSQLPCSQDTALEEAFGAPVSQLYAAAAAGTGSAVAQRALELRSSLAIAEEEVRRVRDRVHRTTAPGRAMSELSAEELSFDAKWMEAALNAHAGYTVALTKLLHSLPQPQSPTARPGRFTQHTITASSTPAQPTNARSGRS